MIGLSSLSCLLLGWGLSKSAVVMGYSPLMVMKSGKSKIKDVMMKRGNMVFTPNQQILWDNLQHPDVPLVCVVGPAGSGKTHLSCLQAIQQLESGQVDKIVLTRPLVSMVDEPIGFLPGSLENKMAPWTRPFLDVFAESFSSKQVLDKKIKDKVIEVIPFSFLQGLTFKRTFVIADEMQHSTTSQIKLLTTRVGTGTKMVILGDIQQSRSDVRGMTGLQDFLQRVVAKPSPLISVVSLEDRDIHRHPLVKDILRLF